MCSSVMQVWFHVMVSFAAHDKPHSRPLCNHHSIQLIDLRKLLRYVRK